MLGQVSVRPPSWHSSRPRGAGGRARAGQCGEAGGHPANHGRPSARRQRRTRRRGPLLPVCVTSDDRQYLLSWRHGHLIQKDKLRALLEGRLATEATTRGSEFAPPSAPRPAAVWIEDAAADRRACILARLHLQRLVYVLPHMLCGEFSAVSKGIRTIIRLTCLSAMCVVDRIGKVLNLQFPLLKQSATHSWTPPPPPPPPPNQCALHLLVKMQCIQGVVICVLFLPAQLPWCHVMRCRNLQNQISNPCRICPE